MTRPRPLATVLRVRDIEEDLARRRLASAQAAQAQARQAATVARAAYDHGAEVRGGSTAVFLAHQRARTALAAGVRDATARQLTAESASGTAREAHTVAARRLAGLERLTERARLARRTELLAAEQRTAEESAGGVAALRMRR
jgi:hypothetical protein